MSNLLWYGLFLHFILSALSAIREAPVRTWAEAAERQETEDDLLSCAWDPAVPLPVPNCPGEPSGGVGQPGNDWGCLRCIGKPGLLFLNFLSKIFTNMLNIYLCLCFTLLPCFCTGIEPWHDIRGAVWPIWSLLCALITSLLSCQIKQQNLYKRNLF